MRTRSRTQAHVAVCGGPNTVMDNFDPADLRIAEHVIVPIAEDKYVQAAGCEILAVVDGQDLIAVRGLRRARKQQ